MTTDLSKAIAKDYYKKIGSWHSITQNMNCSKNMLAATMYKGSTCFHAGIPLWVICFWANKRSNYSLIDLYFLKSYQIFSGFYLCMHQTFRVKFKMFNSWTYSYQIHAKRSLLVHNKEKAWQSLLYVIDKRLWPSNYLTLRVTAKWSVAVIKPTCLT